MFRLHFKYEWVSVWRDRWVVVLSLLFFGLLFFAIRNGQEKVLERQASIAKARGELRQAESKRKGEIDSVARGLKQYGEAWRNPRLLSTYGQRMGKVVAMDAQPLAFVATGQSDLFTHYAKPKLYGEAYSLGFSELANPVQLLFGSFDLAFVCVYLLPLLVLAFSYNLLSSERESGSLRLTLSQPVSLFSWLVAKLALRYVVVVGLITATLLIVLALQGIALSTGVFWLLLLISIYVLFWFAVSFLVSLLGWSSGQNAIVLVSVWVVLVLLVPSIVSQLANAVYPVPSRINMIHNYRVAEADAEKRASEILTSYYRDHPELVQQDSNQANQYQFWLKYFASVDVLKKAVQPVLDEYDGALAQQQEWVDRFKVLSPAILFQAGLNDLAGTSTAHYTDFRHQVLEFNETWRKYFIPRMFANELLQASDLDQLPEPRFQSRVEPVWANDLLLIAVFAAVVLGVSFRVYQTSSAERWLAS